MGLIKGIHHVSIKCSNESEYEEVIKFYGEVLELPVARTWPTGIMFETGCGILEVFSDGKGALPQGCIRHYAFATDDVDACCDKVRKAGYEVFIEPKDIVIASTPGFPARIAFCKGPLGEDIEFFCEK